MKCGNLPYPFLRGQPLNAHGACVVSNEITSVEMSIP